MNMLSVVICPLFSINDFTEAASLYHLRNFTDKERATDLLHENWKYLVNGDRSRLKFPSASITQTLSVDRLVNTIDG